MAFFKLPPVDKLRKLAGHLESDYVKAGGNNPGYLAHIRIYANLSQSSHYSDEEAQRALYGMLLNLYGPCEDSSEKWKLIGLFSLGSNLKTIIKPYLNITPENCLTDEERYIFQMDAYRFIKDKMPRELIYNIDYFKKVNLFDQLDNQLIKTNTREANLYHELVGDLPCLGILQELTETVIKSYEKEIEHDWMKNQHRLKMLHLLRFILKACQEMYPREGYICGEDNILHSEAERNARLAFVATYIFIGLEIEGNGFLSSILPPAGTILNKGSRLYKKAADVLNCERLDALPFKQKINLLMSLHHFLLNDVTHHYANKPEALKELGITNAELENYMSLISKHIFHQKELSKLPTVPKWLFIKGASLGTQTALTAGVVALVRYVGPTVAAAVASAEVASLLLSPFGILITFGVAVLGPFAITGPVGAIFAKLFLKGSGKAGDTAAELVANGIFGPNEKVTPENPRLLWQHPNITPEEQKFIKDWVHSLLDSPKKVVSDKDKECIRRVFGIKPGIAEGQKITYAIEREPIARRLP